VVPEPGEDGDCVVDLRLGEDQALGDIARPPRWVRKARAHRPATYAALNHPTDIQRAAGYGFSDTKWRAHITLRRQPGSGLAVKKLLGRHVADSKVKKVVVPTEYVPAASRLCTPQRPSEVAVADTLS